MLKQGAGPLLQVEVVYALPDQQHSQPLQLPAGATVADALARLADVPGFAGQDLAAHTLGIFGEVCSASRVLCDGDRVEIYRPLVADAKTARQMRAAGAGVGSQPNAPGKNKLS